MFFMAAGKKMNRALSFLKVDPVKDIRDMLTGDSTFLWDIPEFMPLPLSEKIIYIGPLSWKDHLHNDIEIDPVIDDSKPLAVLAFGTCNGDNGLIKRMINILDDIGYRVVVAAGGQEKLFTGICCDINAKSYLFAPVDKILAHASLIVCHGGQMTIFEALSHELPVVVIPFHPEQAHNGVCLERIGCGRMLTPVCRFIGNSAVYTDALEKVSNNQIKSMIIELTENPATKKSLKKFRHILAGYNGLETLAGHLGQ
jgi:UDP:flavonoid glycosyltransferase YjiC (YdhE family)